MRTRNSNKAYQIFLQFIVVSVLHRYNIDILYYNLLLTCIKYTFWMHTHTNKKGDFADYNRFYF